MTEYVDKPWYAFGSVNGTQDVCIFRPTNRNKCHSFIFSIYACCLVCLSLIVIFNTDTMRFSSEDLMKLNIINSGLPSIQIDLFTFANNKLFLEIATKTKVQTSPLANKFTPRNCQKKTLKVLKKPFKAKAILIKPGASEKDSFA